MPDNYIFIYQGYYPPEPLQPALARGVIRTGMPERIQAEKIFQASVWAERVCARSGRKVERG